MNEGGTYAIAYSDIRESFSIEVTTMSAEYKVSYKTDSSSWEDVKKYRYGMYIDEPVPPTKEGELFVGWYYNSQEPDSVTATPNSRWDFDNFKVSRF